ncbi:MAG: sortase [Pseudonocardiales bacterium]|jgi:sortase A|nr:sortase [Pseudonocardiales bacterium]
MTATLTSGTEPGQSTGASRLRRRPFVGPVGPRITKAIYGNRPAAPLSPPSLAGMWVMVAVSVLAAWFVLYALLLSGLQQNRNNSVLYSQLREGLSGATTPIGGVITPGTPIALLNAPQAGLGSTVIVEGTAPQDLRNGPGHRRDTPLPGQPGVSVLYGRSVTYGAPFEHIGQFRPGQSLTVTTGQGEFTYAIDGIRHVGDPLPPLLPAGGSRLLLETSTGSALAPTGTVFVDATLQGKSVAAPAGRPAAILASELPMGSDSSGLVVLVLWLQALVIVTAVVVWARARWGTGQAWLIGLPLVLAVLWGSSGNVLMLLPNLV